MVESQEIYAEQDQALDLYATHLAALLEFSQGAARLDAMGVVQKALTYAVQITESEMGIFYFVTPDRKMVPFLTWPENDIKPKPIEFDLTSIWADCARVGKAVVYNDYQDVQEKNSPIEAYMSLSRQISSPFFDQDKVVIILSVGNKASDYRAIDVLHVSLICEALLQILQHKRLEKTLQQIKYQHRQFAKHIPVGVYRARTNPQSALSFEYVNQQFCEMLDLTPEIVCQDASRAFNTIHPDDLDTLDNLNRKVTHTPQPFLWEGRSIVKGQVKWLRIEAQPEILENGDTIWHGVQTDITEREEVENALRDANTLLENRLAEIEQLQEQLRDQAIRDYLTGLFNRRYLDETIEREIERAKREVRKLSVVMMDIDHFKSINDTYGHQAGDMVLIELGVLLNNYSRSFDIACRHGGDEFVVVMPNASSEDAFKRADEWRQAFEQKRFSFHGRRFATTLSMGIASYPLQASSPKGVFQAADQALYQSKMHNNMVSVSRRIATSTLPPLDRSE